MSKEKKQVEVVEQVVEVAAVATTQQVVVALCVIIENLLDVVRLKDSGYINTNRDGITPITSLNMLKAVYFYGGIVNGQGQQSRYFILGDVFEGQGRVPTRAEFIEALELVVDAHKQAGEAEFGYSISPAITDEHIRECFENGGGSKAKAISKKGGMWLSFSKSGQKAVKYTSFLNTNTVASKAVNDKYTKLMTAHKAKKV